MKTYIGIDNGVTGSIFIIKESGCEYFNTPTIVEQSYTKGKQSISRVNFPFLCSIFEGISGKSIAVIERPMVNPGRFKATLSAVRCLEATLIALERFGIGVQYIYSKEWQKEFLPKESKKEELKKVSCDIACRLYPQFKEDIIKHKDGDAVLIAEYARRKNL